MRLFFWECQAQTKPSAFFHESQPNEKGQGARCKSMQGSKGRQNNNHFSGANIPSSSSKWIGVHLELPKMEGFSSIRIDLVLLSPLSQVDLYRLVNAAISTRARFSGWEGRQQLQIENTSNSYQPILWTNNAYLRHLRATRVSDKAVIKATPIVPKTLFC